MRSIGRLFLVLSGLFFTLKAMPQSDISMSTNWYNRASYNPAAITRDDYLYLFSNIRQQWTGVKGAPTTLNIQGSQYFYDLHSAFGFSLTADKIGATQSVDPIFSYAYRIMYGRERWLSMGLSAGLFFRSINNSLYEAVVIDDPSISSEVENLLRPDANLGFEYQTKHFIYSLSTTHLFSLFKPNNLTLISNHRYCSVVYKNNDPSYYNYNLGLQLINRQNIFIVEGSACFRIKHQTGLISGPREICELGAIVRSSRQLTLLAGLNITPNCKVGYAFNQSFITGYYPNSTHEIVFEYRIKKKTASMHQYRNVGMWYK
jgi:type IX secretion system PorP/SprF family membrane protein